MAQGFSDLASRPDTELPARRAARLALGHADSSHELLSAVLGRTQWSDDADDTASALVLCGTPCAEGIEHFLAQGGRGARLAMYSALALADDAQERALASIVQQRVPSELDPEEAHAVATASLHQ
jgi:hypothetical protein